MKAIFILLDTVNRRFLDCYGTKEAAITPNLDRLVQRGVVFDQHWTGSAPCMPTRRDIMTGRMNFLERPWGGIEPYDDTLPKILKHSNVFTHFETDHYHYVEPGGENYWFNFNSWNVHRGTSNDLIDMHPDKTGIPAIPERPTDYRGLWAPHLVKDENAENSTTPQTLAEAAKWLEHNKDADNYMLWVEGYAPHEPYMAPQEYMDLYDDDAPDCCFWPDYEPSTDYSEEDMRSLRRRYKAFITMADDYMGKILDVMDANDMWKDTMLIYTTDHGFHLGEHGFNAKCYMPDYNEQYHIPMVVCHPDVKPGRCEALTQNIDILPTMMEYFGVQSDVLHHKIHGKSILPLLTGKTDQIREVALYGVFGKTVNITDGRFTYLRRPVSNENIPLSIYCAMPVCLNYYFGYDSMESESFKDIEMGRYLKWTDYPVYKMDPRTMVYFENNAWSFALMTDCIQNYQKESWLFDLEKDYEQNQPVNDEAIEEKYMAILKQTMLDHDAPDEQYIRLGL